MRVNEVRKTETIEKLVRTEYIAEDLQTVPYG